MFDSHIEKKVNCKTLGENGLIMIKSRNDVWTQQSQSRAGMSDGIEKARKSLEYGAQLACRMFIISMIEEIFLKLAYVNTASHGEA